jgi:hypothetical protein
MAATSGARRLACLVVFALLSLEISQPVFAQSGADPVALVAQAGNPLDVALGPAGARASDGKSKWPMIGKPAAA